MEKTRILHGPIVAALCTLAATASAKVTIPLHPLPALSPRPWSTARTAWSR